MCAISARIALPVVLYDYHTHIPFGVDDHDPNVHAYMLALTFSGAIPPQLGGLTALQRLNLRGNQLTGERWQRPWSVLLLVLRQALDKADAHISWV